jgi:hypothetical protein
VVPDQDLMQCVRALAGRLAECDLEVIAGTKKTLHRLSAGHEANEELIRVLSRSMTLPGGDFGRADDSPGGVTPKRRRL